MLLPAQQRQRRGGRCSLDPEQQQSHRVRPGPESGNPLRPGSQPGYRSRGRPRRPLFFMRGVSGRSRSSRSAG
jgi:hypothetical protein